MALDKAIIGELMTLDFDEVVEAMDILNVRQNALIRKFKSGDKVYFERKNGARIEGTFDRMMKKNAKVKQTNTADGRKPGAVWTVHPSFLRKLE